MNVHWERNSNAKCDCTILNLTWMGKVPDELPEDEGWKLNRHNYYQEGWLATGNVRGIVGVTFTSSHCKKGADSPLRTNYNLRGHHSQVVLVKWNEPYQKLASCDATGIIFVWIKYEGRWSVELINDRNTPVTNFAWSHDGRMALICYRDGFVLVGSVAGQRYWSSMLNLPCTITCGVWTPDDQQVYFGTSSGQIIVMDVNGAMVSQVTVGGGRGITGMAWSCEKFKMDEGDDGDRSSMMHVDGRPYVVAVALDSGTVLYLRRFDDPAPIQLDTGLQTGTPSGLHMEWSNAGELLAVAGWDPKESVIKAGHSPHFKNLLKFYTDSGVLLYVIPIPCTKWPVTALTWGHNDKRLFVATGPQVHIAWVCRRIPSLSHLCRLKIHSSLQRGEGQLAELPLPPRMQHLISSLFAQTIRCCVPEHCPLRDFVSKPPRGHVRLHCTMIRHGDDTNMSSSGTTYTLYLEYLGGLVPLLKGKRTSKIRPEFVIFDPRHDINASADDPRLGPTGGLCGPAALSEEDPESDSSTEDGGCVSPRLGRRRQHHHPGHGHRGPGGRHFRGRYAARNTPAELVYRDNLSEDEALTQVTSNIWGTRFKVIGLRGPGMPAVLGQITYKTSLLHLQPRQMTLCMTELRDESSPPIIFGLAPPKMLNPKTCSPAATAVAIAAAATAAGAAAGAVEEAAAAGAEAAQGMRALHPPVPPRARGAEGLAPFLFSNTQRHRFESTAAALAAAHAQQAIAHAHAHAHAHSHAAGGGDPAPQQPAPQPAPQSAPQRVERTSSHRDRGSQRSSQHRPRQGMGIPALARAESYNDDEFPQVTQIQVQAQVLAEGSGAQRTPALQSPRIGVAPVLVSTPVPASDFDSVQRVKSQLYQFGLKGGGGTITAGEGAPAPPTATAAPTPVPAADGNGGQLYQLKSNGGGNADGNLIDLIPVFSIPSELNKIADLNDPDAILPDLIIPDVNIEDLNIPAFMDEPEPSDDQGATALAAGLNFIDDEVGEVRIGPVRSVSVGFLHEAAVGQQPPRRLVLTSDNKRRGCSKSMSMGAFPGSSTAAASNSNYLGPVLGSTMEDDDTSPARSRRTSPVPHRPNPSPKPQPQQPPAQRQPQPQPPRQSRTQAQTPSTRPPRSRMPLEDDIQVIAEALYVDLPPDSPPDEADADPSEEEKSCPFAPLVAAEVPLKPKKKKTLFDLSPREMMTLVDWSRRRKSKGKKDTDTEAILDSEDADSVHKQQTHSTPPSPTASKKTPKTPKRTLSSSPIRQRILNSPLLRRRRRKGSENEGGTDGGDASSDEAGLLAAIGPQQYSTLESFQKAQLRQKLKQKKKNKGKEDDETEDPSHPRQLQFIMHNKAPMWNENSQVYQLDFGGRVTQESAKNFQIEFLNKQVMQFGRIDANAYTLDFQYPFSALQAFAVALANITQRLK